MRRSALVVGAVAAAVVGAGALAWHLSEPWRERRAFVNKCLMNGYTLQTCSCTYEAYKDLKPPYAALVRSSVHDSRLEFTRHASTLFGRKLAHAGLGIDPAELDSVITKLGEDASIGKVLGAVGSFLERHKYKIAGHAVGAGALMAVYRTGRIGYEVGQVTYAFEKHCGAIFATIRTMPGRVLGAAKDASDGTWKLVKDAADSAWTAARDAADWTFSKAKSVIGR